MTPLIQIIVYIGFALWFIVGYQIGKNRRK